MAKAGARLNVQSLVDEHYEFIYRYAYRLAGSEADAEDLTQDTFLTAQAKGHQLRKLSSARAWLCAILRSHYLVRSRRRQTRFLESLDGLAAEPPAKIPEELPDEFDAERLQQILESLPESYRTPLILFYFEEFSYREIAEQMQLPIGTVMSRLARGKAYLRESLCILVGQRHFGA